MKPLVEMPRGVAQRLVGVLTDFDGTMTTGGKLTASAFVALWRLKEAGLRSVIVTGRSAGWADMMVRNFPVDAVVAEQGGVTLLPTTRGVDYVYARAAAVRAKDRRILLEAVKAVQKRVPQARIATDAAYARVNMAFDHGEERHLTSRQIDAIENELHRRKLSAVRSSVHVNFWVGRFSKLTACESLIRKHLGGGGIGQWVFVGDSVNDAPMFAGVPDSVGVANVRDVLGQLPTQPAYVTKAREGRGFEELVNFLLRARAARR